MSMSPSQWERNESGARPELSFSDDKTAIVTVIEPSTWHGGPARPTITYIGDGPTDNRGSDWQLWIPPTGPECYDAEGGGVGNSNLRPPYGYSYWPTQQDACEFLAEQQETRVEIPVQFIATYQAGKITALTVLPWESYAGYFGAGSVVLSGNEQLEVKETDGPFWRAMQDALGLIPIEWEE